MSPRPKTVLIVDDDEGMRDTLGAILRRDHRVVAVETGEAALEVLKQRDVDLMLLDVRLPGMGGLEVLRLVKENHGMVEVIMISAINEVETAVLAMKRGAYHYVTKDFEYDTLRSLVANAAEKRDLSRQVLALSAQVADQLGRDFVVGRAPAMREIMQTVEKIAGVPATVLILGESGTGKELLARTIHERSEHAQGPFVAVNLAAIPAELVESTLFGHERGAFTGAHRQQIGRFEMADGGTLFLDEIGDLRPELQAKLLRAIQEGEIERVGSSRTVRTDFRLIVATNVDLERAVKEGLFREDLFYRINVIPIRLPPLRERLDDLDELIDLFVRRYSVKFRKPVTGVADSTRCILRSYHWPGNVRELENLVERLVAVNDRGWIDDEDLPFEYHLARIEPSATATETLFQTAVTTFERNFIVQALRRSDWNVSATARYLGIPLSTLKHKMGRLDVREVARRLRSG